MLRPECPNCRRPLSPARIFFTPMWGTWRCPHCASLLGVDRARRGLAMIPFFFAVVFLVYVLHIANYGLFIGLPIICVVGYANFALLDRARLLESTGFRCRQCGYDLRAQTVARCPECGLQFDPDTTVRNVELADPAAHARAYRQPVGRRITTAIVFSLTTLAMLFTLVRYVRWDWLLNHPQTVWLQIGFSVLITALFFLAIIPPWRRP